MTTKRVKKIKRLGWLALENGEPTMIEIAEKNTVYLGSWGNAVPCSVTITYSV